MKATLQWLASALADALRKLQAAAFAILLVPVGSAVCGVAAADPLRGSGSFISGSVPAASNDEARVRLAGHRVALGMVQASPVALPTAMTVTLTLLRDDERGFQQFLHDLYDPKSPEFHHFLTQAQIADRFGPSTQAYERVVAYLSAQRLGSVERSANRLTVTATGTRDDVERAFDVRVLGYRNAAYDFYATDREPALPAAIAARVQAVSGLSTLAQPRAVNQSLPPPQFDCPNGVDPQDCDLYGPVCELYSATRATGELLQTIGSKARTTKDYAKALNSYVQNLQKYFKDCLNGTFTDLQGPAPARYTPAGATSGVPWHDVDGSGQTIGIVAFDDFQIYDVVNYLNLVGAPSSQIANLATNLGVVNVGAGASFGPAESEVLLDIDMVMGLAPNAKVIVYSSGFPGSGSSFQNVFNKMLSDGLVTIISNSWAYCEDQTSLADVQSIDSILQSAAVAGISVFSASGDSGSACLDGSANVVTVPADSPHITAVGGTTLHAGAGGVYKSESWWDGSANTPPSGQGGFGVSKFFSRPSYQNGFTASTMRSIPDVSAPADPVNGISICQTDAGGCPTGLYYGGTSMAAPAWAAFTALLNQAHGSNLGFMNTHLYPLSATSAFHGPAAMAPATDFAHVGLGSPNLDAMSLQLDGQSPGAVDAAQSEVLPTASPTAQYATVPGVPADGTSVAVVIVTLRDANGNTVPGKTVTLAGNAGNHATITPPSGLSSVNDGTVQFLVTDLDVETVTFKATDTSDAIIVTQQPSIAFVTPPAAFSSIMASPTTAASDGIATSTITVTLEDKLHRPTPGKQVLLNQNHNSVITGTNPVLTDAGGTAQFLVVDQVQESVHYDAVDLTDGNLPIPNGTFVTFNGSSIVCPPGVAPLAGLGYRIEAYASGFPMQAGSTFGNVTLFGCLGVTGIAFDDAGNLFAAAFNGNIYKFPPGGGIASNANRLGINVGQGVGSLTFGTEATKKLYGVRIATTGDYTTGGVIQIDQATGAPTTVGTPIACAFNMATDPLTGSLFVGNFCTSTPASPTVWRVESPGTSPSVSAYADSESAPNGSVSAAPDGTLYVVSGYTGQGSIDEISGTDQPPPPSVTPTGVYSTYSASAYGSNPEGGAQALVTSAVNTNGFAHSVAAYDMTATPPAFSGATLVQADIGEKKIFDASGCLYLTNANVVYKVSNADGTCPLAGLASNPSVVLTPEGLLDNLSQGLPLFFDVTFPHTGMPEGTPVRYAVTGANHAQGLVLVGADNRAVIKYAGQVQGVDTMVVYAVIGGNPVASNPVEIVWHENKHATSINLNDNVTSATLGSSVLLRATIYDASLLQAAPIPNVTIQFSLSGQSCSALTDATGVASCAVTVSAQTQCTLEAAFVGNATYLPSTAKRAFTVSRYDVLFANGFEGQLFDGSCVFY